MTTRRAAWASEMYIPTTNIREGDNGGRRRRRGKTFSEIGWLWLFGGLAFGSCFPPLRLKGSSLGLALQRLREGTEAAKTSPPPAEAATMSLPPLSTLEASPDQVFTHVFLAHKFRTLVSDARSYQLPSSSLDFFFPPPPACQVLAFPLFAARGGGESLIVNLAVTAHLPLFLTLRPCVASCLFSLVCLRRKAEGGKLGSLLYNE